MTEIHADEGYIPLLNDNALRTIGNVITAWARFESILRVHVATLLATVQSDNGETRLECQVFFKIVAASAGLDARGALTQIEHLCTLFITDTAKIARISFLKRHLLRVKVLRDALCHRELESTAADTISVRRFSLRHERPLEDHRYSLRELHERVESMRTMALELDALVVGATRVNRDDCERAEFPQPR